MELSSTLRTVVSHLAKSALEGISSRTAETREREKEGRKEAAGTPQGEFRLGQRGAFRHLIRMTPGHHPASAAF